MKSVSCRACWVAMVVSIFCPPVFSQSGLERRQAGNPRYRVGLVFSAAASTPDESGLRLYDVVPDGAAARAGLKAGDLITQINGKPCSANPREFASLFGSPDPIEFQVLRDNQSIMVTVVPEAVSGKGRSTVAATGEAKPSQVDGRTRVPTSMEYGKPAVMAKVNGTGPWKFLVDSGAGVNVFDHELVKKLELPVVGKQSVGDPSDPEAIDADVVRVDSIVIGDREFHNIEAASWDRMDLYPTGDRPMGVLGIELFADYLLTFDFPSGEIWIEQGELPAVDEKEILSYTVRFGNIPSFQLTLAGETIDAHFDTGSPAALSMPTSWESRLKLKGPVRVIGRARTVNSEFEVRGGQLDGDLAIGGHVFHDPQVVFASVLNETRAANVGSSLLGDFALTFDQKNRRLRIWKP